MFPRNTCLNVEYEARTETNLIKNSQKVKRFYICLVTPIPSDSLSSRLIRSNTPIQIPIFNKTLQLLMAEFIFEDLIDFIESILPCSEA